MSSFTNIVKTASSAQTQPVMAASVLGVDEAVKNNLPDGFTKSTANGSVWYDDYYDESYSVISAVNKVVTVDASQVNLTQENNSQFVPFKMPRYYDGVDLSDMLINIHYVNANDKDMTCRAVNVCYSDSEIRFGWLIDEYATSIAGKLRFEILITGTVGGLNYVFRTMPNDSLTVVKSLVGNGTVEPDGGWESYITLVTGYVSSAQKAAQDASASATEAKKAVDDVRAEVANSTDQIKADVLSGLKSDILADYYNKTEVDQKISNIDISDQLDTVKQSISDTKKELQGNIDAVHSLDNLKAKYEETATDGVNRLTLYDLHGEKENILGAVDINHNPTDTWKTSFKEQVDSDVSAAVIAGITPVSKKVDEHTTAIQKNADGIAANKTNVSNLTGAVNDIQTKLDGIKVSQQYTYDATYGSTKLEGQEQETQNVFTLYEIENEGDTNESRNVKSQFVIQGGGGGGGEATSTITIERVTASPYAVVANTDVIIQYNYSSVDAQGDTVDGVATWKIGSKILASGTINQGLNKFDATKYCSVGEQKLTLSITNDLGTVAQKSWVVKVVEIGVSTTFNSKYTYSGTVDFPYTPVGAVDKTVYLKLDGKDLAQLVVGAAITGTPQSYAIPAQTYGSHLVELYIKATVNDTEIESEHIFKDIIWINSSSTEPIIGCDTQTITAKQYSATNIVYTVYNPATATPTVQLYADDKLVETRKLSSSTDTWVYKSAVIGAHTLKIVCGSTEKIITVNVTDLGVTINPVTANLAFDFNPVGYSNTSTDRLWKYNDIVMSVSDNFNWNTGGYQTDGNGDQCFVVKAGTKAYISFDMFSLDDVSSDPKRDGREFKIVYKVSNVKNVDTTVVSCIDNSNNVGFKINAHEAYVSSSSSKLYAPLAEEDIIEFEFDLTKAESEVPMVMSYEDGCPSKPMIYSNADSFVHNTKQQITIGSADADIAIYRMKAYTVELSDREVLNNFIADARNAEETIRRYERNQIYNESGVLTPESVAAACPDLRVIILSAPYFTDDKKNKVQGTTVQCIYNGGTDFNTDNWTATGAVHNGQGTSSNWYGLAGRNLEFDLRNATITYNDGSQGSTIQLSSTSVPTNYLNFKANIASSENANNALFQKRFERFRAWTTLADKRDDRIKNSMEFFNAVVFVQETNEDITTHNEFADTNIHFYAIGNIGDSKKTDATRAYDPNDPYEFTLEITDYDNDLSAFPTNVYFKVTEPTDAEIGTYYELSDGQYTKTTDQTVNMAKTYYFNALEKEQYNDSYNYDVRYGSGTSAADVWPDFYKMVIRPLTGADGQDDPALVAQWKKDFKNWFVLDSAIYFYLYTLRYTMIDNRAKNTFWHYAKTGEYLTVKNPEEKYKDDYYIITDGEYKLIDPTTFSTDVTYYRPERKFDFWAYDMDSAEGIDNRGELTMSYGVEEMDKDESGSYYFRAGNSTFFTRLAKYFADDMVTAYNKIEAWNAENLIAEFDTWQEQFPEELWRLDYERKYLRPYIGDAFKHQYRPNKDWKDEQFLRDMMNGRKKYQRRQFERDQEIYMSSKFPRTSGFSNFVQMRCSSPTDAAIAPNYTMHITPYSNLYLNVMQGQQLVSHIRAVANTTYDIEVAPDDTTAIDFIYIHCANRIKDFGDLSRLYLSYCAIGSASKLQRLQLGSDAAGYTNKALATVGIGNNTLLEEVNLHNLSALQGSVDLSGCGHLKKFDARGTMIGGVTFANGGEIEEAYLPSSIASIVMRNLSKLTGLHIEGYDNLRTIVAENSEVVNTYDLVNAAQYLTTARLTDINWDQSKNISDASILKRLYDIRGLDATLTSIARAIVSGYVYAAIVKQKDYNDFQTAWPDLTLEYGSFIEQYAVTFVNYDGTPLEVQWVDKGSLPVDPATRENDPLVPTRESSVSTDYTFSGWDSKFAAVFGNRTYTAQYTESVRNYTVNYSVRGRIVQTETVPYGSSVEYKGDTPTYTSEETAYSYYLFSRWDKSGFVNGDKTINAVFDHFVYQDGAFDGLTSDTMTPVQYYALTKLGNAMVQKVISIKDGLSFNLGHDFTYEDIESKVLIDKERVFDGTADAVYDTGINLIGEDKSWVLAVDYKLTGNNATGTLFENYQGNSSTGFRFSYRSKAPTLLWGASGSCAMNASRDIVVLRHVKGENMLHVYKGNLPADTITYVALDATRAHVDTTQTLVFGGSKDFGEVDNPIKASVYWAKVWYDDLGDTACQDLALWTHETIELEAAAFRYYYLSDGTGRSNITWLAAKVLEEKVAISKLNTNEGGWSKTSLRTFLNGRFYKAIPTQWRQLIKQCQIPSSAGNKSSSIVNSDCYVEIPAVIELVANDYQVTKEPYLSEGGVTENPTISYLTTNDSRIRTTADGVASDYYTRSPHVEYTNYFWYIEETGSLNSYYTSTTNRGILVELSF